MRGVMLAVLLGGCYGPRAPAGVPCDPVASHCPAGQACRLVSTAYVCTSGPGAPPPFPDAVGEPDRDASLPPDAIVVGPPDAAIDAPPTPVQKTYTATVAECIDPTAPDPALCRSINGNEQLVVDLSDSAIDGAWFAFVRFDIDTALQGLTVTNVTLRLTATSASKAASDETGSIWRVTPFTLQSLSTTTPTYVDASPLAPSQGPVAPNDVFDFTLPTTLVTPGSPVYLGITRTPTARISGTPVVRRRRS